jgi:hypothetical protein
LEDNSVGPALSDLSADSAISLWWSDCSTGRRVNQKSRQTYSKSSLFSQDDHTEDEDEFSLETWDNWFDND